MLKTQTGQTKIDWDAGINGMIEAATLHYKRTARYFGSEESHRAATEEFRSTFTVTVGRRYIKVRREDQGTWAFIVIADDDKLFDQGDILKPASHSAAARNFARGNVLRRDFRPIRWTGPANMSEATIIRRR